MVHLPQPGADAGKWGDLLNEFLRVEHNEDGTLKAGGSLANKYTKPPTGIPETDLSSAVQTKLSNLSGTNTGDQDISGLVPKTTTINNKALSSNITLTGTDLSLTKSDVGLSNVDNTSDVSKPISTAAQAALTAKADDTAVLKKANNLSDVVNPASALANIGAAPALTPTDVKTNAYTAAANQLVPADATSAAFTITLPATPTDKSRVSVKKIDGSVNIVTVAVGGSDVFNKAGGGTSITLQLLNQAVALQYHASGSIWYVISDDLPLSSIDTRYTKPSDVDAKIATQAATDAGQYQLIAKANRSNFVAYGGDSITTLNGNGSSLVGDNWNGYMPALSLGRITNRGLRWTYSTAGYTVEQWEATWLPQVLATSGLDRPSYLVLLIGTNNMPSSTFNFANDYASLLRCVNSLLAANIIPILATIPPRGDNTTANTNVQTWNAAIIALAGSIGLTLLDVHAALVDPATGVYKTGHGLADNVHPSPTGMKAMATACYPILQSILTPWTPKLSDSILDSANVIQGGKGLFVASGGTLSGVTGNAGVGSGWNFNGSGVTPSLISDASIAGQWQRISRAAGGALSYGQYVGTTTAVIPGHRYACATRIRTSGVEAAGSSYSYGPSFKNSSNGVVGGLAGAAGWTKDITGVIYSEGVAPATAVILQPNLTIPINATGGDTFDIAQVTIYDLTALGLA